MCHHFTWRWYCWCLFSWWSSGLERMMHNQRSLWQGHGSCFFSSWLGQMPCVSLTKPLYRQTKHFPHFLSMLPQLWMNSGPLSMPGGEVALPPCSFLIWKKTEPGRQNQQALVGSAEHFWRLRVLWGIMENWGGQNPVFKKKKKCELDKLKAVEPHVDHGQNSGAENQTNGWPAHRKGDPRGQYPWQRAVIMLLPLN